MDDGEMFTDTVNFRRIAVSLRRHRHTSVPVTEALIDEAKEVGGVQLVQWVLDRIKQNEGNFTGILAFHLAHAGNCDENA